MFKMLWKILGVQSVLLGSVALFLALNHGSVNVQFNGWRPLFSLHTCKWEPMKCRYTYIGNNGFEGWHGWHAGTDTSELPPPIKMTRQEFAAWVLNGPRDKSFMDGVIHGEDVQVVALREYPNR